MSYPPKEDFRHASYDGFVLRPFLDLDPVAGQFHVIALGGHEDRDVSGEVVPSGFPIEGKLFALGRGPFFLHDNTDAPLAAVCRPDRVALIFKVDFFAKDVAGSGNLVPLGKTPFYVIPFTGLEVGETIDVDGDTWMCFPFRFTWHNLGYAFRIA